MKKPRPCFQQETGRAGSRATGKMLLMKQIHRNPRPAEGDLLHDT